MKIGFSIGLLVLLNYSISAQIDAARFAAYFDDEKESLENIRVNHSDLFQYELPQELPSWFFNPPMAEDDFIYSIGISDPALDSIKAMGQAQERALIMASLTSNSLTQLLCRFYMDETKGFSNVVYENYARVSANLPQHYDSVELVNDTYNAFGEAVVLIKYKVQQPTESLNEEKIVLDIYKNEFEGSQSGIFESIYELSYRSYSNDSLLVQYQMMELGSRTAVSCKLDSISYELPIYTLKYYSQYQDSSTVCFYSHGLWKEYFKAISSQIVTKAQNRPENIQVLGDNYSTDSYQKMVQGISQNKQRLSLKKVITSKNILLVHLMELNSPFVQPE